MPCMARRQLLGAQYVLSNVANLRMWMYKNIDESHLPPAQ